MESLVINDELVIPIRLAFRVSSNFVFEALAAARHRERGRFGRTEVANDIKVGFFSNDRIRRSANVCAKRGRLYLRGDRYHKRVKLKAPSCTILQAPNLK